MENIQQKMEQLQMEIVIALEDNDEELYQQLLLVLKKLEKEKNADQASNSDA